MTCIVGYLDKNSNTVTIGGDSAGVSGLNVTIRKDEKVFTNGDFIIGCTTSFRMIQLLRFSLKPPKIKNKEIYEYMCTDFINAVRKCFKKGGYLQKETKGDDKGGIFLVGYKNRLFRISQDFQVGESLRGYDAIGCGENYALGAIFTIKNHNIDARDKVLKALECASYFSGGVCEPFITYNT